MKKSLLGGLLIFSICGISCKPQGNSETKFDDKIDQYISYGDIKVQYQAVKDICSQRPLFVFVGNGERAGKAIFQASVSNFGTDQVVQAANAFRHALTRIPSRCVSEFYDRLKTKSYQAMLLTIIDGDGGLDSSIETNWFSYTKPPISSNQHVLTDKAGNPYAPGWRAEETQKWRIDSSGKVVAKTDAASMELHLPTHLQQIIEHFLKVKPPGQADFQFDQTLYYFKTHGGRFGKPIVPGTLAAFYEAVNDTNKTESDNYGHAFLFDLNGPDASKTHTADLYTGSLKTGEACQKFAKLSEVSSPTEDLCSKCIAALPSLKGSGLFKKCGSKNPTSTAANSQNTTLSPEAETTLSPEAETTLSPEAETTLSPEAETTLSPEAETTLSPEAETTLGGKALFFGVEPDVTSFPKTQQLGQGLQYSGKDQITGMKRFSLPLSGRGGPSDCQNSAPFVLLDSCYGDPKIGLDSFSLAQARDPKIPIIVAVNPNPMDIAAIDYGKLDYFQYLAMPYIFGSSDWCVTMSKTANAKRQIVDYLETAGLQQSKIKKSKDGRNNDHYKLRFMTIRNGRVEDEYVGKE